VSGTLSTVLIAFTVYDIFLCRHTVQIYSLRSLTEVLNVIRNLTL